MPTATVADVPPLTTKLAVLAEPLPSLSVPYDVSLTLPGVIDPPDWTVTDGNLPIPVTVAPDATVTLAIELVEELNTARPLPTMLSWDEAPDTAREKTVTPEALEPVLRLLVPLTTTGISNDCTVPERLSTEPASVSVWPKLVGLIAITNGPAFAAKVRDVAVRAPVVPVVWTPPAKTIAAPAGGGEPVEPLVVTQLFTVPQFPVTAEPVQVYVCANACPV
jgi:hypothetical protein